MSQPIIRNEQFSLTLRRLTVGVPPAMGVTVSVWKNPLPERLINPCDDVRVQVLDVNGSVIGDDVIETSFYQQLLDLDPLNPRCVGHGAVRLPQDFDPKETVTLSAFRADDGRPLGQSGPVRLDDEAVTNPPPGLPSIAEGFFGTLGTGADRLNRTLTLGLVTAGVVGGLYFFGPLLVDLRESLTD